MGQDEHETDAKIRNSRNSAYELMNPLEKVKKTFQAFESLNFDVRARSYQITILGQVEHDLDAKKRSSRNSFAELTNPLEMVSELGIRPKLRFWAKMSKKQTRKIVIQQIQLLFSRTRYKW